MDRISLLKFLVVIICLTHCSTSQPVYPHGKLVNVTIDTPDGPRSFVVYNPTSRINATDLAPVAILLHPLGGDCSTFISQYQFLAAAEKYAVILQAPCGTKGELGVGWNAGTCCGFPGTAPNDYEFIRRAVFNLSGAIPVEPKRIGSMGIGNGAFLSQTLSCKLPALISLSATVGGVVELRPGNRGGLQECDAHVGTFVQRSSILLINGDNDQDVPWNGFELMGFPSIPENVAAWANRSLCTAAPQHNWLSQNFSSITYSNCDAPSGGVTVQQLRWWGGDHQWPSASDGFDATDYFFSFLSKLAL